MKFVTFLNDNKEVKAGILQGDTIIDLNEATDGEIPLDMIAIIERYESYKKRIDLINVTENASYVYLRDNVQLLAPIPRPTSVRDFYAFEEHVKTARGRRGLDVVPEWYDMPVFYFTNHLAIKGPNEKIKRPSKCEWMDYELEIACVVGKQGSNISEEEAEDYIFGYCILNDWSARDLQREEMKVGLGPAKGKDFATSIGPYIVTKDELEEYRIEDKYDLEMTAKVNGQVLSKGNFKDIYYTFSQMIKRASEEVTLYPGDIIGSGTVGTGCILELGTDVHRWLEPGDEVELAITGLGSLKNRIIE